MSTITINNFQAAGSALQPSDMLPFWQIATGSTRQVAVKDSGLQFAASSQAIPATATLVIDLSLASVISLSQDVSITSLSFINPPSVGLLGAYTIVRTKDATGTSRLITWPSSFKWPAGTAPTLTQTTGAVDIINFFTVNGGAAFYATSSLAMA